jgi:tetratricopeptide (TPR) repeat protein
MKSRSRVTPLVLVVCLLAAVFTGCSRDPNVRKQKYLESGQRYFDKGRYREAAIQFQNAIQVDGRFAEAHYRLALTDMRLQQPDNAFRELERAIEIRPDNYAAHLDIANLLIGYHQLDAAKEHLDLLTQKQPDNAEVYVALANYNAANKNMGAALEAMQKALKMDPNRQESYLNMAVLEMNAGQWKAAEDSFNEAVRLNPKSGNALISLGNFYQSRGRFPEAEQQFRSAIANAPSDPEPRGSLARLYMAENKPALAEEFLKQAKKDFPDNSLGYRMLGDFYVASNQPDKAVAEYSALYQEHPSDLMLKKTYIELLIQKDRIEEARKLTDEVLKSTPGDLDAQIDKAQIELQSGQAAAAVNILQGVLKNDPDNAVAHYQLGLAFDRLSNIRRAEAEWREAVRLRPDIVQAHRALAGVAIHRGDANILAQEADQIINYQPDSPDGYLLRAVAEIDRKQYAKADDFLKQSLAKAPNNAATYVQVGNLRIAQGQPAAAQKAYQQALDLDPNSPDALGGVLNGYLMQKQEDKAFAAANAQLAKYPSNSQFHVILGRLLAEQKKNFAGAENEFKRAAQLDKNNTEALAQLGMAENGRGATDEALETFLNAAKANPKEATFLLLAGGLYETKQSWDHAKQMYQKVLELEPDNALASNNLAYVMLEQGGNVDVALAMAQTARRQLPDNPSSADTLGWAYYHKGVYTSAIGLFKEAVKKEPENATFVYHLGLAYAKNGQAALARQQLDRVSKIKPGSSEAEDLRRTLAQIKG